jgi:hypothetical protein
MCSQPTQLARTRRNSRDANGKYTLRVRRTPLGDITASSNARTPISIAPKRLSFWSDDAAIRALAWREAHVVVAGDYDAEVVQEPTWRQAAREFELAGDTEPEEHAAAVRLKRLFESKPDELDSFIIAASRQLREECDRKVERAATKRASAAATRATPAPNPTREQCAADFAVMVKEIHTTRTSVRAAVTKWNACHNGPARTSRDQVSRCLKRLQNDLKLGCTLEQAYVPFNNRGWHKMSLSREGEEFLAEGIALHLSNCNLIFKEDVLRAAHGLLKREGGEDVKVPTEGWYTGFVKRHKLKKKRCKIVEASRLLWATAENMQRWYLDNTLPFLLEKKLYTANPEWRDSPECTVPAAFVNPEMEKYILGADETCFQLDGKVMRKKVLCNDDDFCFSSPMPANNYRASALCGRNMAGERLLVWVRHELTPEPSDVPTCEEGWTTLNGVKREPKWMVNAKGSMDKVNMCEALDYIAACYRDAGDEHELFLFLDGNPSHMTYDVLKHARDLNISILFLVPHCTHLMQGEDVVHFSEMKRTFHDELRQTDISHSRISQLSGFDYKSSLDSTRFFAAAHRAFLRAFTPELITRSWSEVGLSPFNYEPLRKLRARDQALARAQEVARDASTPEREARLAELAEYQKKGLQSGEFVPELLLPAGDHDLDLATARLLKIAAEAESMDEVVSRAETELNQTWSKEQLSIMLHAMKLRPKRKRKNPIQAVATRGPVANTRENLAILAEIEVERAEKDHSRVKKREERVAKEAHENEAACELWNHVVAELAAHGAHRKLSTVDLRHIVRARNLVPGVKKTALTRYTRERLMEIIQENNGCPDGFGTILPATGDGAVARKRRNKTTEDNETTTEEVNGALGDALDPKPPSPKRRCVQKPTESEEIQKTSKETLGCGRCRYSRKGCDRCDPARKKKRTSRKRSGTAKKR